MLRGLTTVSYFAADVPAAKGWYARLLELEPYYERPGYVEFRIGDYQHELGIIDAAYASTPATTQAPAGAVVYWAVDDVHAALDRLLSLGAQQHQAPRDFGGGFVGASVIDPFGNILAVMENPHYQQVLASRRSE